MPRPIACLRAEAVADEVLRLAAGASCELDRVADRTELSARWANPPLVIVDDPALCHGLPKREGVLVLHQGPPPPAFLSASFDAGATRVLCLPDDTPWLASALADAAESPPGQAGPVIAVIGGTGGAGASTFAAAVALTAVDAGTPTLLVDCDPLSGGMDLLLGAEDAAGLRWPDISLTSGRISAKNLAAALPTRTRGRTRLTILSGAHPDHPPTPDAVTAVIAAGRRAGDTVICDLPRHPTPTTQAALATATLTTVVVPADVRSCAAAHRITRHLRSQGITPHLIIRGPSPSHLTPQEIARSLDTPLLTHYTTDRTLPTSLDKGTFTPRTSLTRAAQAVLDTAPT